MLREIDRRPQLTVVEPATGAKREQLISEYKSLFEQRRFEYDSEFFGRFVRIMVGLIGGEKNNNDRKMTISTPFMIDKEGEKAIRFKAGQNVGPEVFVQIGPAWLAQPEEEKGRTEAEQKEPYLVETVRTNYIYPSVPFMQISQVLVYPKNSQRSFLSYATPNLLVVKEGIVNNKLLREEFFSIDEQRLFAEKIFKAWQSSQPQTFPAPQA